MHLSKLELRWAQWTSGGKLPQSRGFLDFIVDGVSLRGQLKEAGNPGLVEWDPGITPLGWSLNLQCEQAAINRLLGEAEPESWARQCSIFICPACGDLDCGAITTKVEKHDNLIVWSNFATEQFDWADDIPLIYPIDGVGELLSKHRICAMCF